MVDRFGRYAVSILWVFNCLRTVSGQNSVKFRVCDESQMACLPKFIGKCDQIRMALMEPIGWIEILDNTDAVLLLWRAKCLSVSCNCCGLESKEGKTMFSPPRPLCHFCFYIVTAVLLFLSASCYCCGLYIAGCVPTFNCYLKQWFAILSCCKF